jgi:hypothetical protein
MNLKPIEQAKFQAITTTVNTLKNANLPHEAVVNAVSTQISDFETTTRYVVKIHEEAQGGEFVTLIDTKKDFIRARPSGDTGQVLRAKVYGVPIDVKALKTGEYSFTNAQLADALDALSVLVRKLDKEVISADITDFSPVDGKTKGTVVIESDDSANVDPDADLPDPQDDLPEPDLDAEEKDEEETKDQE